MENKGLTGTEKLSPKLGNIPKDPNRDFNSIKLARFFAKKADELDQHQINEQKKEKQINKYINSINKKVFQYSKQYPDSLVSKFSKIEKNIETLETFPQLLLKTIFKEFDTCQIIVHKKGDKIVQSFSNTIEGKTHKENFQTKEFNKIFTTIKKSKLKKFDQTKINSDILKFVGHFLADNVETEQYNLILAISRNGFLPPEKNERETFRTGISFIKSYLEILALNNNTNILNILFRLSFKYYPMPLSLVKDELVILSNDKFQNENKEKLTKNESRINNHFNLNEYINSKDLSSSIIHDEKIKLLGELLNTLKHELSNPLFGLQLSSEILSSIKESEEEKSIVGEISKSVSRCHDIIQTFGSLSNETEEKQTFEISELVNEVFLFSKSATKPIKKSVNFSNPNIKVSEQYTVLFQIIFNLIVNAAQAIKESTDKPHEESIEVFIDEKENHVTIKICDSGPGIPLEKRNHIFKPFYTTKKTGNGLGLSICKGLAKKIGAELDILDSSTGASFEVKLKK